MEKNKQIAQEVLELIGGADNVTFLTHCITRLRFNLKDQSIVDDEKVKAVKGVIGVNHAGDQYQVIIGPNVEEVYKEFIAISGLKAENPIDENLDGKKDFSLKSIGSGIMDYLSGTLTKAIPVMLAAAMFKMLVAVLGPSMLNVLSAESNLYVLFEFVGDAGYYFFPIYLGFAAATKLKVNPYMGAFMGGILLHPTVASLADTGFTVYGIPANMQSYSSTVLPIILGVWVMSYVERFFKKYTPASLKIMGVPFLTTLVMIPMMLVVCGPLGGIMGRYVCAAILWIGKTLGPIGPAVIGATWEFLVMTGMHQVMIPQMIVLMAENGFDPLVSVGAGSASMAVAGMCFGLFLAQKNKENKSLSFTYAISSFVGGITEPGLYGAGVPYGKPLIGMIAGGAAGGFYAALLGVKAYNMVPVASFLCLTSFAGGSSANLINGIISGIIALVVSTIVTYIVCKGDKKIDE